MKKKKKLWQRQCLKIQRFDEILNANYFLALVLAPLLLMLAI